MTLNYEVGQETWQENDQEIESKFSGAPPIFEELSLEKRKEIRGEIKSKAFKEILSVFKKELKEKACCQRRCADGENDCENFHSVVLPESGSGFDEKLASLLERRWRWSSLCYRRLRLAVECGMDSEYMKTMVLFFLMLGSLLGSEATSFYSTTEVKSVAVIADSQLEKEPEIDHFEHLCPGYGGYELLHRSGDARSWLDVRYRDITSDLYQETMSKAQGSFPFKENDVVEWRGILKGNVFTPFAIIYRLRVQDIEEYEKSHSRLVVIALNEGEAKVIGVFGGAKGSEEARAKADSLRR